MLAGRYVLGVALAFAGCGAGGGEGPRPVGAAAPLRLVADAFLCGRTCPTEAFHD